MAKFVLAVFVLTIAVNASTPLEAEENEVRELANSIASGAASAATDAPAVAAPAVAARPHLRARASAASAKAAAPVAVDEASKGDLTASGLEGEVQDLLKMSKMREAMGKEAFEATPFGSSVQKIMDVLEKTMMPSVLSAHDSNEKELEKLAEQLKECGKTRDLGVAGADKQKGTYLKMSPLHQTCRNAEAGLATEKDSCTEELKDKKNIKNLKCKAFALVSARLGDQNANKQIVKKGGGESVESYVSRISTTVCGTKTGCGFQCQFAKAKKACGDATKDHLRLDGECKKLVKQYDTKKTMCNNLQKQMDGASCKRAVDMKDACESYSECYTSKKEAYHTTLTMVKKEEEDRKGEWKGLKRMHCLMKAFSDGKVRNSEIKVCKEKTHDTDHLIIKYPELPSLRTCEVPELYPTTAAYKRKEFAPLPALAKGKMDAFECTGITEAATTPAAGSPDGCTCKRVTMNGPYSAGPLVKCSGCLDVRRTQERNSCPIGTKIFSPRSRADWQSFLRSAKPLRDPSFIIDVTRPRSGCGGCTDSAMNSKEQKDGWKTLDGSAWWLRSSSWGKRSSDYRANCYMDLGKSDETGATALTWEDKGCKYHSKSYYCQPRTLSLKPKKGSPAGCVCTKVELTSVYSAGALIKCSSCLDVHRSTQKNSCPSGTKIFSPATRKDWETFLASAKPLRSPHWIIDVTRPQSGCGGCTGHAMNSGNAAQATWRTSDGTPWWLRGSKYGEPNGDYTANCYMNLQTATSVNSLTFNDGNCNYHSNSYYCQTAKKR